MTQSLFLYFFTFGLTSIVTLQAPLIYDMNASIYVFDSDFLRENDSMWDAKCDIYIMKDTAILDIDSEEDFEFMKIIAECLYDKFESYSYIRDLIR